MNMETVMEALGIMGKGMLGIFVVIVVIALLVYGLTKITSKKKVLTALKRKRTGSIPSFFVRQK